MRDLYNSFKFYIRREVLIGGGWGVQGSNPPPPQMSITPRIPPLDMPPDYIQLGLKCLEATYRLVRVL